MGMLKRKDPNQTFPDIICKWCGKRVVRTTQCSSQWAKMISCSSICGRLYNLHKCSKKDYRPEVIKKNCQLATCNKPLFKRENESWANWKKRLSCNKSCAASYKATQAKLPVSSTEAKVHVKIYIPGSPEFNAIAKLYGG